MHYMCNNESETFFLLEEVLKILILQKKNMLHTSFKNMEKIIVRAKKKNQICDAPILIRALRN